MADDVLDGGKTAEDLEAERVAAEAAELAKKRERGDFLDDEGDDAAKAAKAAKDAKDADGAKTPEELAADKAALVAVAGEDDDPDKPAPVPYSRFREVNEKLVAATERAHAAELAAAKGGKKDDDTKPPPEDLTKVDVDDLRDKAADALLEGDKKLHLELTKKADAALRAQSTADAVSVIEGKQETARVQRENTALLDVATALVADYPMIDSNNPKCNKEAVQDVVDMRDVYVSRGMSPAKALAQAAEKVVKQYGFEKVEPKIAEKKLPAKSAEEIAREATALARSGRAAESQPPKPAGKGERGHEAGLGGVAVEKLTDAQFKALTKEEKALLRGDVVS